MQEKINFNTTLGDFVALYPKTKRVFGKFGLDYCCGGKQKIQIAAEEKNIDLNELTLALEKTIMESNKNTEKIWINEPLTDIINHIVSKHHAYLWEELPYVNELLEKVVKVHGPKHGDVLNGLNNIYKTLKTNLEQHLKVEETQLFPYVKELEVSVKTKNADKETELKKIIGVLYKEHEEAGDALSQIRNLTSNFLSPDDACESFEALYENLQLIEADLHEHVHLENTVLFPRITERMSD